MKKSAKADSSVDVEEAPSETSQAARPIVQVSIRSNMLIGLVVLIAAVSFGLGWAVKSSYQTVQASIVAPFASSGWETLSTAAGQLELKRVSINPPLEYLSDLLQRDRPRRWVFANKMREDLDKFLRKAGLSDQEIAKLWEMKVEEGELGAADSIAPLVFNPTDEFILSINSEPRAKIYAFLSQDDRNLDQANAGRYIGTSVEEWLAPAALPDDIVALVKSLSYRNAQYWMFADLPIVIPKLKSAAERNRLVETIDVRQTWMVRFRVNEHSDLDSLAEYWGRGGRVNIVRPLLRSLATVPGGETVSVRAMLPSFVKTHLFVCPTPSIDPIPAHRDCHWTTLNFFNEELDDSFVNDPAATYGKLTANYHPVYANFKLGDIVIFYTQTEAQAEPQIFHSCVYLADDVVFTKNGRRPCDPWIFMRFDEMKNYYPRVDQVQVAYLRRNDMGG
jgi:hypothetical protein